MPWFSLAERELRVSARRKLPYRLRVGAGTLTVVSAFVTIHLASQSAFPTGTGKMFLQICAWLALTFCLIASGCQTVESLSSEKRDGTLGLLLLTPLSGFDIVFAKFVAASLNTFVVVLATFPAMAISLLVGGATPGEFWRAQLVILDGLVLSVACGLWTSATNRTPNRAFLHVSMVTVAVWLLPTVVLLVPALSWLPSLSPAVSERNSTRAAGLTLVWTAVVPWAVTQIYYLAANVFVPHLFSGRGQTVDWVAWTSGVILTWFYYALLIQWARENVVFRFRRALAENS